jgi:hypothetical protein
LELEADKETLKFCQKKEFFVPTAEHELKIVLQTWHDLLELLTIKDTVGTKGLARILEKHDEHCQVVQEMFTSIKDCGLTVMVILDNHLQKFFEMVSEMDDVTKASSKERNYLHNQASDFLDGLENCRPPAVVIPQCLRRTPTPMGPSTPKVPTEVGGDESPAAKKKKKAAKKAMDDKSVVTNKAPQQAWSIPQGKSFLDFFNGTQGNDVGWPKLTDGRFESTRNMRIRFQVKGSCTQGCTLAHTVKSKMSGAQETQASAKFCKICQKGRCRLPDAKKKGFELNPISASVNPPRQEQIGPELPQRLRESGAARAGRAPSYDGNPQRRGRSGRKSGPATAGVSPSADKPSAVADEKAGQPERAFRPAMTAIPSDVGKVHEKAGQPHQASSPAMTAIPSDVKGGRKRSPSPQRQSQSESPPGSGRRLRSPVTRDRDLNEQGHNQNRFETPVSKPVSFASPEGVDPKATKKLLLDAAARNENWLAQANLGNTNTPGKNHCPSDPNCFLPDPVVGPDDTFVPPAWFTKEIAAIAASTPRVPTKSSVRFDVSLEAVRHNATLLRS